jgi:hypothetical protein
MVERAAVGSIGGETTQAMEDRELAVRVVVDPHPGLDEVPPQAPIAHGCCRFADHALLLSTEDFPMRAGAISDGRGLRLRGRDRESGVVLRQMVMPASDAGSLRRRSWRVPKARSERARASGE